MVASRFWKEKSYIICVLILTAELGELIQTTRGMIELFSKAKAAKLIRELVDRFLDMNKTIGNEVSSLLNLTIFVNVEISQLLL